MTAIQFKPPPSVVGFLTSEAFVSLIVGPVGSTKTSAGIMKIAYHAKQMAPCNDGVRRSRCVWIRNTRQMLTDTSIPDFLKWFPDGVAGSYAKTDTKFILRFDDVECEVLFRGLDDANDVRRLLSLQLSFAVMDEFREIAAPIYEAVQGRLGRYPDKMLVPPRPEWGLDDKGLPVGGCVKEDGSPNKHLFGMTNPPDQDTFWETLLTEPPSNVSVFFQPSGMSAEADWLQYLPSNYYEDLAEGKSQDWIDVYIHAKFGKSLAGEPVFRSFRTETHVSKSTLNVLPSTVIIGVDAGLTPAAVVTQLDFSSRLIVHNALTCKDESMGALRFIREKLKPLLANKFQSRPYLVVIDPAAFQRSQTDERTVADIYKAEGFKVVPARTNTLPARIAAVDNYLTRTVNGQPAFVVDKDSCTDLITALRSKYRYKISTKGEKDESPEKNHPWSDVCFIAGTRVNTPQGAIPIELLQLGDEVCVADGTDTVVATGAQDAHLLVRLTLSNGSTLVCTPDHPFAVGDIKHPCFLPADALTCKHVLISLEDSEWANGANPTQASDPWSAYAGSAGQDLKLLPGESRRAKGSSAVRSASGLVAALEMVLNSTGYGSPEPAAIAITGINVQTNAPYPCTNTYGKSTTAPSYQGTSYTTSITTQPTTKSQICVVCRHVSTLVSIFESVLSMVRSTLIRRWKQLVKQRKPGTEASKVGCGTRNTLNVSTLTVVRKDYLPKGAPVFNLRVARTNTYFVEGVLVHNCDALQYAALHADNGSFMGAQLARGKKVDIKPSKWVYV